MEYDGTVEDSPSVTVLGGRFVEIASLSRRLRIGSGSRVRVLVVKYDQRQVE